ncbi:MAG: hypothetical protein ABR936_16400 [Bacteroidota bacterium]|jgi:hypothetical protein
MSKIKRQKRKKKEQDGNLPMPIHDNPPKIEDGINSEPHSTIEEKPSQQNISTILIPKETLFVEESRYAKPHFFIQTFLAILGFGTLIGFIYYNGLQHEDSVNALKLAEESYRSADSIAKISYESQRIKDSITLALTDSSLTLTRQSNERADRMSKYDLRPYIVLDTNLIVFTAIVNRPINAEISISNIGKTPAYNYFHVNSFGAIDTQYTDLAEEEAINDFFKQSSWHKKEGNSIGSNLPQLKRGTYGIFTYEDSVALNNGKMKLILCGLISYNDIFKERHFTWYCYEFDIKKSIYIMIPKHTGAN